MLAKRGNKTGGRFSVLLLATNPNKHNSITPVMAGEIPSEIYHLVRRTADEFDETVEVAINRDLKSAYEVFCKGHLITSLSEEDKRKLFDSMYENTKNYLPDYR